MPEAPGPPETIKTMLEEAHGPTWMAASGTLWAKRQVCEERRQQHYARAARLDRIATPLAWLTAVLAAVSGLSIVANYSAAATVLGLATAVAAATNAALSPGAAARSHRAAATGYTRLGRKLDDYVWLTIQGHTPDNVIGSRESKEVIAKIREFEGELTAIEESHPPISAGATPWGAGMPMPGAPAS